MILQQLIRYTNADALEAAWVDENGVVIKCHAYSNHPEQMAQLRADLGADAAAHEALIAEVEATYVEPEPALAEPIVRCTRRQGRLALLQAGLLFQVEAMIAGIPDDLARTQAQIEYETDTWEADNATLQAMWEALGKTPDELAEFFALAVQL